MKIYYENTLEDLADCNVYTIENSSFFKIISRIYTLIVCIILLVIIILVYNIRKLLSTEILVLYILLIGMIWFFINPKMFKKTMRKHLIKNVRDNLSGFPTTEFTLTLNEERISIESKTTQYKVPWSSIENVKVRENYICIYIQYLNKLGCFVVPIKTFNDPSEKDAFLQIFKQHKIDIICV
ncbi:YcxB family protein [Clostridium sp. MSJ-4]|uniref:YcxB family protein n=1 Tax=Clostridium simiarum TaxID=2841506 RepID=A0ABS6F4D0_9CLOT|nr:YcxB family protein [Clostridium simiarum]